MVEIDPHDPTMTPVKRTALGRAVHEGAATGVSKDGRAVVVEESVFEQPTASASYEDLVAAESAALGAMTREIAERIAALPSR